jgi:Spy/CpxP family protein refolding chaperone
MKTRFNKKIATAVMTGLIAVSFIPAVAGACRGRGGGQGQGKGDCAMQGGKQWKQQRSALGIWKNPKMMKDLALTPEQVGKLKDADFAAREKQLALKAEMASLRLQMDQAFTADPVDDATVRGLAEKMAAAKGKMSMQRVETRLTVKNLLAPEQVAKLQTLRQGKRQGKNGMNKPCMMNGQGKGMKNGQGQGQGMGRK